MGYVSKAYLFIVLEKHPFFSDVFRIMDAIKLDQIFVNGCAKWFDSGILNFDLSY